jgi:hypothetical protein
VTSFANNTADLLYKMQQQPATRGWLRRDLLAKGLNFPQDLTVGHQVYARHPESGEYCLVSLAKVLMLQVVLTISFFHLRVM